jgi:hypothetical protein
MCQTQLRIERKLALTNEECTIRLLSQEEGVGPLFHPSRLPRFVINPVLVIGVRGEFLGIIGGDLSISKSNELHVDIFWFFFINSRYII